MPGTPIQTLIMDNIVTRLEVMAPPAYTYQFARVAKLKENIANVGATDKPFAFVYSGPVSYLIAGTQAAFTKLKREMSFVVGFVFDPTPTDPTDPLSVDRDSEALLMFADIHKCLFAMDGTTIANTVIEVSFSADFKDLTDVEIPEIYGELHGRIGFRHNLGDATTHS
jgi:hypothetical protein